jgi:hypothetical protein
MAFDVMSSASSRLTLLSEFSQPNNSNAGANGALEWSLLNVGNSHVSFNVRGGYTYQPDNNLAVDEAAAGFSSSLSSKESLDGLAFGGGIGYDHGGFGLSLDYARRNLGILGGTDFFSATLKW